MFHSIRTTKSFSVAGLLLVSLLLALALGACGDSLATATVASNPPTATTAPTSAPATPTEVPPTAPDTLPTITAAPTATPAPTDAPTAAPTQADPTATAVPDTATPVPATAAPTQVATAPAKTTAAPANSKSLLAYVESGDLYVINPDGTGRRSPAKGDDLKVVSTPDWSPDNSQIVVAFSLGNGSPSFLQTIVMAGEGGKAFAQPPDGTSDSDPKWSPDGKTILFTRTTIASSHSELWLVDSDGQNPRKLADGEYGSWSPDGQRVAFVTYSGGNPTSNPNALHIINSKGQNEWEPLSVAKIPTDLTSLGYPFGPDTIFIQYPVWLDGGKTIGFTTIGHSGLVGTISSTTAKDLKLWDTQYEGGFGITSGASAGTWLAYESFPPSGFVGISLINTSGTPNLQKSGSLSVDNPQKGILAIYPALNKDGSRIAYLQLAKNGADVSNLQDASGSLMVASLSGGKLGTPKELIKGNIQFITWSH